MRGFPVILSAPSGAGKTSIRERLLQRRPDVGYSTSCTTRTPRVGETEGQDYHFVTVAEFERSRDLGDFAEWAVVHGHLYGTRRSEVERILSVGKHVLMDIDVQGARQFAVAYPESVLVFILPPSGEVLLDRLSARGSEDKQRLLTRLESALTEMQEVDRYHYVVVNEDLGLAVDRVSSIIDAEAVRHDRVHEIERQVEALIEGLQREIKFFPRGD